MLRAKLTIVIFIIFLISSFGNIILIDSTDGYRDAIKYEIITVKDSLFFNNFINDKSFDQYLYLEDISVDIYMIHNQNNILLNGYFPTDTFIMNHDELELKLKKILIPFIDYNKSNFIWMYDIHSSFDASETVRKSFEKNILSKYCEFKPPIIHGKAWWIYRDILVAIWFASLITTIILVISLINAEVANSKKRE